MLQPSAPSGSASPTARRRCDRDVATSIAGLRRAGRSLPGARASWQLPVMGVAVLKDAPRPDISTPEAFRSALLAARSVAYFRSGSGGASGAMFAKVLKDLGIAEAVNAKAKLGRISRTRSSSSRRVRRRHSADSGADDGPRRGHRGASPRAAERDRLHDGRALEQRESPPPPGPSSSSSPRRDARAARDPGLQREAVTLRFAPARVEGRAARRRRRGAALAGALAPAGARDRRVAGRVGARGRPAGHSSPSGRETGGARSRTARPSSGSAHRPGPPRPRAVGREPVAILSDNSVDHALLTLGALHAGVPVAPISPAYSLMSKDFAKLRHIVELVSPGLVWTADPEKFAPALAAIGATATPLSEPWRRSQGRRSSAPSRASARTPWPSSSSPPARPARRRA